MKKYSFILTLGIIVLFGALHIQPVFNTNCLQQENVSCKSKCSKTGKEEQGSKPVKGCNPFVPCSMGSCCYVVENFFIYSNVIVEIRNKILLVNDNRLSGSLSECWHPPEMVS